MSADFQAKLLRVLQDGEVLPVGAHEAGRGRRARRRRDEPRAPRRGRGRPLPRGPLLPPERDPDPARAAPRAPRRRAAARAPLPRPPRRGGRAPARVQRRGRAGARSRTRGPATCASSRTPSSAPSCWRAATSITPEDLLLERVAAGGRDALERRGTLQQHLDSATADRIRAALDAAHGQRAEAARALGIDRTTLYRLMKRLGI